MDRWYFSDIAMYAKLMALNPAVILLIYYYFYDYSLRFTSRESWKICVPGIFNY